MIKLDVLKYKKFAFIFSLLFIVIGIVVFIVAGGFNKGIDFGSGYSETFQIAPLGFSVTYTGKRSATLSVSDNTLVLQFRDADGVEDHKFPSTEYPKSGDVAAVLSSLSLNVTLADSGLSTENLVSGFGYPSTLSSTPHRVNFSTPEVDVTIEDVREAVSNLKGAKVQTVGDKNKAQFQVRIVLDEGEGQEEAGEKVESALSSYFGGEKLVVLQSNYVGPKFSASLLRSSLLAVLIAFVLILLYISIRFRLAYALSSIIALIHDVLMMLSFVVIFRLEVSGTTIAAVLTIIGYSLNNTIVIFDRVRENIKNNKGAVVYDMVSLSVRQSFTRTFITTLTTLFAIVPLAIFGSGEIKLFAINLIWGLVIGAYSSSFIAPCLVMLFHKFFPIDKIKEKKEEEEYSLVD
ncbi:MAG: protein translocase subunit SecF [Candidatus Ornithospirochaeta sp.]